MTKFDNYISNNYLLTFNQKKSRKASHKNLPFWFEELNFWITLSLSRSPLKASSSQRFCFLLMIFTEWLCLAGKWFQVSSCLFFLFHWQLTGEEKPHDPSCSLPVQVYVVTHFLLVLHTYHELFENQAVRICHIKAHENYRKDMTKKKVSVQGQLCCFRQISSLLLSHFMTPKFRHHFSRPTKANKVCHLHVPR